MDEYKEWITRAEKDLNAAIDSYKSKNYEWACFQAQQAVEKALKSLYIKKFKQLITKPLSVPHLERCGLFVGF